jgi:hypothetical protein
MTYIDSNKHVRIIVGYEKMKRELVLKNFIKMNEKNKNTILHCIMKV